MVPLDNHANGKPAHMHKSEIGGILVMLAAMAVFMVNDSFLKLAAQDLPPFAAIFLRGIFASIGCAALVVVRGDWKAMSGSIHRRTLIRAAGETGNTVTFIIALANMPIANAGALLLTAPLMMVLGAALVFRERIGPLHLVLVCLGFGGALLVAQPGTSGFNAASLFALGAAVFAATRDLVGRTVPTAIPTTVVVFATMLIVTLIAGLLSVTVEIWVPPTSRHLIFLALSGATLVLGQVGLFLAYRIGRTATVAPFFYSYLLWGVVSGLVVWHELPNPLALGGIALIVASGVAIVVLDQRRGRDDVVVADAM
ncbi:DMT family transporter [Labrys wisconsinensis]|uniref:Drug/metabolite transporter (DMT)-like permease n=1 Tax=Labrys wisconsinensis TaxID=425677 RepID=A0ABU0J9B7_9HYPH|nr:DMT family transporter [Labrys wisconsinensis]MDQ0470023.1 drug/metabolite transporter (DMT)-like permease [Labrys wisconsinensis]